MERMFTAWESKDLPGFNRCWWRMLETKCVGDNYKMLTHNLFSVGHNFSKEVTNIMMSPISLSPDALNQNRISFVIQVVSTFGICFVLLGHTATTKVNSSHFSDSYKLLIFIWLILMTHENRVVNYEPLLIMTSAAPSSGEIFAEFFLSRELTGWERETQRKSHR